MSGNGFQPTIGRSPTDWAIFPCHSIQNGKCTCGNPNCRSPGKHPRTKNGLLDATNDATIQAKWAKAWPQANVAVATGEANGIVVVDIDPRHGGSDSMRSIEEQYGELPETVEVETGGGGLHLYFRYPASAKVHSRNGWRPGVDIKADGGYVIVPPSNHASGGKYRCAEGRGTSEINIAEIPEWLLPLLPGNDDEQPKSPQGRGQWAPPDGHALLLQRAQQYVAKAGSADEGTRNDGAFKLAGHVAAFTAEDGSRLSDCEIVEILRPWNMRNSPPLDDDELQKCVANALKNGKPREVKEVKAPKGRKKPKKKEPDIANYEQIEVEGKEGKTKTETIPLSMNTIIDKMNMRTGHWPRRVDTTPFVDDEKHGLGFFDRRTTAGFFGWLRRNNTVDWHSGGEFVSQSELFAEVERTAIRYEGIELIPHEPPIDNIYYRCVSPTPGDGSHLQKLLNRFRPATTIDRDLIQAAIMTAFWGGPPGRRPAFVITSDDGRGVGKTTVAEVVGYLCGGHIDVSANEDFAKLKERLLTPTARTIRIALLDNVKTLRLSCAELESLVTSSIISGKQLYVGEGRRPNLLTWFITLNGVSMATDMSQRSVIIKVVKGKNKGTWWENTCQFIDKYRAQIIGDIIAALRAEPRPLAAYSRWATWEQHVLCRLPDPGEAQRLILERQAEANCELDEAEIIEEFFAKKLAELGYDPETAQVRIPVAFAARWYSWAVNEPSRTAAASKRLRQMANEGQTKRIAAEKGHTHGRCFIWTGPAADVFGGRIENDLQDRISRMMKDGKDG